ncbi:unnamed protein product, partial [Linum tenue]
HPFSFSTERNQRTEHTRSSRPKISKLKFLSPSDPKIPNFLNSR